MAAHERLATLVQGGGRPAHAYRPAVDLATSRVERYECIAVSEQEMVPSTRPGPAPDGHAFARSAVRQAIDDLCDLPVEDLMISIPADDFVGGFPGQASMNRLAVQLRQGKRLTVMVGWPDIGFPIDGVSDALGRWRALGCDVGIDNFGYAPIPLLWPFVFKLDVLRIDSRLIGMAAAGVTDETMLRSVLGFVSGTGIRAIIVDGCTDPAHHEFARIHGATHGQGPLFGRVRFSPPRAL